MVDGLPRSKLMPLDGVEAQAAWHNGVETGGSFGCVHWRGKT